MFGAKKQKKRNDRKNVPTASLSADENNQLMSQVNANPEEIEQFAISLSHFESNVREELLRVQAAFTQLSESWIDESHQQYSESFEEIIPNISRLLEETPGHVQHLLIKAQQLRDFLSR